MKIISINAEKTVSPQEIAFNVDEDLTPEFIAKICYGVLKFSGTGRTLVVQVPSDIREPFSASSVRTLNTKLQDISDEFAAAEAKRQQMLEFISANTGLKLG